MLQEKKMHTMINMYVDIINGLFWKWINACHHLKYTNINTGYGEGPYTFLLIDDVDLIMRRFSFKTCLKVWNLQWLCKSGFFSSKIVKIIFFKKENKKERGCLGINSVTTLKCTICKLKTFLKIHNKCTVFVTISEGSNLIYRIFSI